MNPATLSHHILTTFPEGVAFWTDVVKSLGGTYIAPNLPDPFAEKIEALMEEALAQGLLQEPQLGVMVAVAPHNPPKAEWVRHHMICGLLQRGGLPCYCKEISQIESATANRATTGARSFTASKAPNHHPRAFGDGDT